MTDKGSITNGSFGKYFVILLFGYRLTKKTLNIHPAISEKTID